MTKYRTFTMLQPPPNFGPVEAILTFNCDIHPDGGYMTEFGLNEPLDPSTPREIRFTRSTPLPPQIPLVFATVDVDPLSNPGVTPQMTNVVWKDQNGNTSGSSSFMMEPSSNETPDNFLNLKLKNE